MKISIFIISNVFPILFAENVFHLCKLLFLDQLIQQMREGSGLVVLIENNKKLQNMLLINFVLFSGKLFLSGDHNSNFPSVYPL